MNGLEPMGEFFDRRIDGYEQHMFDYVDGAKEYYKITAEYMGDVNGLDLLDLGIGTGLELDEIVKLSPNVRVTGIDLSTEMLKRAHEKFDGRITLRTLQQNYLTCDFGVAAYDRAISVQTLHHFTHVEKLALYAKLRAALKPGGFYVETDYVAPTQQLEDEMFAELARLRQSPDELYHFDTPCTVDNQLALMSKAGFSDVKCVWRVENTAIMIARV